MLCADLAKEATVLANRGGPDWGLIVQIDVVVWRSQFDNSGKGVVDVGLMGKWRRMWPVRRRQVWMRNPLRIVV